MKKITALVLVSIALAACKKESKTITKIDPVTGDTITIDVPSADSAQTLREMAQNAAIKDSAGIFTQSLKLEKGKTYPFTTHQKDVATAKLPDGSSQSMTRENTDEITFTVNNFDKKVYDVTINFVAKKTSQSAQGKTETIDTRQAAPKDEGLKNRWTIDKAMTGNKLNMKIHENGNIISINGFEPIYSKFTTTVNGLTKDANERKALLAQLKASFNEEILKDQFSKNIFILPKKGAKIGEKWTVSENASPDGKIKIQSHYTLKKVNDGVAEITITGGIPKQSNKETQEGVTQTLSSELTQNGTYTFDVHSGWIINQNIHVKTSQSQTFSDGKNSETMTNTSDSYVIVNPKK